MYAHNEIFLLEKFYMYLYVFERHDVCLNARVEVRGQFAGVSSPRHHVGPIDQTQVIRLAEQMLLPTELPHPLQGNFNQN